MDRNAPVVPKASPGGEPAEASTGGWVVSSFDLLHGADVDTSGDTVPDELFDELFPAPPQADSAES